MLNDTQNWERRKQQGLFRVSSKQKSIQRHAHSVVKCSTEFDQRVDLMQPPPPTYDCLLSSFYVIVEMIPSPKGTWKQKDLFHLTLAGNDP